MVINNKKIRDLVVAALKQNIPGVPSLAVALSSEESSSESGSGDEMSENIDSRLNSTRENKITEQFLQNGINSTQLQKVARELAGPKFGGQDLLNLGSYDYDLPLVGALLDVLLDVLQLQEWYTHPTPSPPSITDSFQVIFLPIS